MPSANVQVDVRAEMEQYIKGIRDVKDSIDSLTCMTGTAASKLICAFPHVPSPKHGGTFFYCPWNELKQIGSSVEVSTCGVRSRFRTEAAYRRHWRKAHS